MVERGSQSEGSPTEDAEQSTEGSAGGPASPSLSSGQTVDMDEGTDYDVASGQAMGPSGYGDSDSDADGDGDGGDGGGDGDGGDGGD